MTDTAVLQTTDETLRHSLQQLPAGRPALSGMWKSDSKFRRSWTVWPQLKLEDGVLDRVKQSPGSSDNRPLIVLPQRLLDEALCQLHDNMRTFWGGKTVASAADRFWWPAYISDIQRWVKSCEVCARSKPPQPRPQARLQSIPVRGPMEMVAIEVIGPLRETANGNRFILAFTDYFTKWPEAFPMKSRDSRHSPCPRGLLSLRRTHGPS